MTAESIMDSRARVLTALSSAGLRTATTRQFQAPCVLVEPGDPWSEPWSRNGQRIIRWRLTAVAGRVDSEAAYAELGALLADVDAAFTVGGIELPTWARPTDYPLDGAVSYAASVATVQIAQLAAGG